MNRKSICIVASLALLLLPSCGPRAGDASPEAKAQDSAPFDLAVARAVIEQKNAQFTQAHVTGDVATIDAMFTRDATSFPPGAEPAVGPAALHALTVDFLKIGVKAFTERTTTLYGNSELLIDQGEYEITYGPANTVERGKYVNVWRQEDGTWKIQTNIWNTSPALAPK
jgi:ketosteroid isomerase-like protein